MAKRFTVDDMFSMMEGNEFATCIKCGTEFYRPDHVIEKGHPGIFCSVCRKKGHMLLGIVHFIPDCELNIIPAEIMTA